MTIQFLSFGQGCPTHIVKVMSPLGVYPSKTIIKNSSVFYSSNDICFTIAPYVKDVIERDSYYSEVEWATINEIKLFSSILLSVDRDISTSIIYPFHNSLYVEISNSSIEDYLDIIKNQLIQEIDAPPKVINGHLHPYSNIYKNSHGIALPPICNGPSYQRLDEGFDYKLQSILFNSFDITDHLMIRGVSTLLRSGMLSAHHHFLEEAINTTFISLEASYRLVLKRLKETGERNPSAKNAADFIANIFNSHPAGKYFEEYYESRIMSFHPESRFGIFPHAPLMADDCYDLSDNLLEIYRYLICGYVLPKHQESFNQPKPWEV